MSEATAPAPAPPDPHFHVVKLSEPVGDAKRGVTTEIRIPRKIRVRDLRGVKFIVSTEGVELSTDAIIALACNLSGLDADVFDEIPASDIFQVAGVLAGTLGKSLLTSTTS